MINVICSHFTETKINKETKNNNNKKINKHSSPAPGTWGGSHIKLIFQNSAPKSIKPKGCESVSVVELDLGKDATSWATLFTFLMHWMVGSQSELLASSWYIWWTGIHKHTHIDIATHTLIRPRSWLIKVAPLEADSSRWIPTTRQNPPVCNPTI